MIFLHYYKLYLSFFVCFCWITGTAWKPQVKLTSGIVLEHIIQVDQTIQSQGKTENAIPCLCHFNNNNNNNNNDDDDDKAK